MNKKLLLAACLTAFSAESFSAPTACASKNFDGFYVGVSAGYRIQTAKDKVTSKAFTVKYNETKTSNAENPLRSSYDALVTATGYDPANGEFALFLASDFPNGGDNAGRVNAGLLGAFNRLNGVLGKFSNLSVSVPVVKVTNIGGAAGADAGSVDVANFIPPSFFDQDHIVMIGGVTDYDDAASVVDTYNSRLSMGGLLHEALKQVLNYSTTSDPESKSEDFGANTTERKSHNQQGCYGLRIGYGHSFNKFYVGAELNGEMFAGKLPIKPSVASDSTIKTVIIGNTGYGYGKEMPNVERSTTLKNKWLVGLTVSPGWNCGNVVFYLPLGVSMTRYEVKFVGNADNHAKYGSDTLTYTNGSVARTITDISATVDTSATAATTATTATDTTTPTFTKQKTKVGFSFGLGATIKLNDCVSVDFRGTYSPNNKIKIDTPAYTSKALHDSSRLGERHEIKLSNIKLAAAFIWHFN